MKLNDKVVEEIVRYALQKYGNNAEWKKTIFERLSFHSIAKFYFKEFVNYLDLKQGGENEKNA